MYRQSSARNQRSKGFKLKHILQICLLLAVCFWLIYQVKHSHDKKKEFDESNERTVLLRTGSDEFIKFGRKDIHSRVDGTDSKNEKDDELAEEEEEAAGEKIEENKREEDEPEYKGERKEEDAMGGGDDEADEHEQEKSDGEVDREEEVVDEEEEREDSIENGNRETDSEHAQGQVDKEVPAEDTDRDGDDRSINEAREEHYKADDASSAVTHNTQITGSANENEHGESSNEIPENISEDGNKENNSNETNEGENRKYLELDGGETAGNDHHLPNVTATETKFGLLDNSENGSAPNNTVTVGFSDHSASNRATEVTTEHHDSPLQNITESEPELNHGLKNLTEGTSAERSDFHNIALNVANHSVVNVNGSRFDSNSTVPNKPRDAESHSEDFPHSSDNNTESSASEKIIPSEPSVEAGNNTEFASERNDEMKTEQSYTSDEADETMESTMVENPEDIQHDAIDISDTTNSLEEKNVRVDLDTLPEIQTQGTDSEDVAAE